jgi:hypothetical protein
MARPSRSRRSGKEISEVPEELAGFPGRLQSARELAKKGPSELKINTSRYERGLRLRKMSAVTVVRLARELGVSVGYLLAGENTEPRGTRLRRDSAPIRAEEIE